MKSVRLCLCLTLLFLGRSADAAVTDYLGRTIVELHLRSNGAELNDPALLEIVETKVGQPLAMAPVRETLAHLFGLGRYQQIEVDATARANGVVLTYSLVVVQRVRRIAFEGALVLSESDLRRTVVDRYSASPPLARAPQVVETLRTLYRDHGYPRAQITAHPQVDSTQETATLVFAVQPGTRARVGAVDVQGTPVESVPSFLNAIDLRAGEEYDGLALDERLDKYVEGLRSDGYYLARASQLPRYTDEDRTVNLAISVDPGPHVELVFQGDPLTSRERQDLIPIAREHSVDEDILEDSKFGVEGHFRAAGFCNPRADYQRTTSRDVMTITFTIARGPQCTLEQVSVVGNTSVSSDELNPLIRSAVGQPFNENTLGADAARIDGLYRRRGFASVKVASEVERGQIRSGVTPVRARLVITEGVRTVVDAVSFDGNSGVGSDALRQAITSAPGQPYFEPQITADADALVSLYLNRGYPEISVQPSPRPTADRSAVDLRFVIHEGPEVLVDHVLIVGNERTKTERILREVQFKSDRPLSQQDEDETRSRLTGLAIFRRVEISYLQVPGSQTRRDVLIRVEEAPLTSIGYGGGVEGGRQTSRDPITNIAIESFEVAPRGFFQIGRRNLFGGDRTLNLFTRLSLRPRHPTQDDPNRGGYGFDEYLAQVTYGERRIFGTPTDGTIAIGVEQARRTAFYFNRRSANLTLARRLSHAIALSGRYSIERTRLFNIATIDPEDVPLIDRLFPQVRLSAFSGSLIRDTRDDAIDPGRGALIGLDGEVAARRIGSEVGFFKTFLQGFVYRRVAAGTVIASGARVGLATGFPRVVITTGDFGAATTTTVDDLPASERFFAGGDTTVRGFTLDRLGTSDTIDPKGFPKGGNGLIVLNTELRRQVRGGLGVVTFIDAGNVFSHVTDMDLGQLRGAYGFGIRYRSPIGPIRVDLGFKMDRRTLPDGTKERPTALHISLGQAF